MSIDIVRIALANFTDWAKFEQLATEIMRDEGYPDIKPLGGQQDGGKDAVVERFYSHTGKRTRTVFQFSLRKDILEKIKETIQRLNDCGTEYEKLVLVTTTNFSTKRQEEAKKLDMDRMAEFLKKFSQADKNSGGKLWGCIQTSHLPAPSS